MTPLINYWTRFKKYFVDYLSSLDDSELLSAWEASGNRTKLYENRIIQSVANKLELEFIKEDFKIDYTLCQRIGDYKVPLVFIESENDARSADHEIRKLCCMNAPLKVLIVCSEWSDEKGYWKNGGDKQLLTEKWQNQIRAHGKIWSSNSVTAVIVAEWKEELRYYSFVFDSYGNIIEDHEIFFRHVCSN
jgi:hypothetical protein